jgi:hypothetical protein
MKLNIKTITILCFIASLIIPSLTHAQPVFDDDVNDVPIDGGLSLLVAAGVGYGAKKLKQKRKNTRN